MTLVENGQDALMRLTEQTFDLVLMDMVMPVMDGCTATRMIRAAKNPKIPKDIPVIALTANAGDENRETCLAAGMNDFISKPLDLGALREKITYWGGSETDAVGLSETTSHPEQVIDFATAIRRLDGDREALAVVTEAFCEDAPKQLILLLEALSENDLNLVKVQAHSFKGASLAVGALELSSLAAKIEELAVLGEVQQIESLCKQLAAEVESAITVLKQLEQKISMEEKNACLSR
jgi:CheY-like chemotaxis protein